MDVQHLFTIYTSSIHLYCFSSVMARIQAMRLQHSHMTSPAHAAHREPGALLPCKSGRQSRHVRARPCADSVARHAGSWQELRWRGYSPLCTCLANMSLRVRSYDMAGRLVDLLRAASGVAPYVLGHVWHLLRIYDGNSPTAAGWYVDAD